MSDMVMVARRRFFAEELEAVCTLRSPALVDAFAAVPRERYLRPGPWTVLAESDSIAGLRTRATPDADPARVCHNIAVAIDPQRLLFNGQPATLGPLEVWLDSVAVGGRMVLPLTGTMPAMGATIDKGLVLLLTRLEAGDFAARVLSFVAIYSALGLRDAGMNERLGKAMTGGSIGWQALRRDPHEQVAGCWLRTAPTSACRPHDE